MVILSKEFTKEEVIQNKKDAIRKLNKLLEYYINNPSEKHLKKAHLISYWIKDYVRMINFEDRFEPTKNIAYKRGNVVKINFGFKIGSEYGGLHYGVVLDNKNDHSSPVITVIPLTSVKDSSETHNNSVELGNDLYRTLKLKYDTISKSLKAEQQEITDTINAFSVLIEMVDEAINNFHNTDNFSEGAKELIKAKEYLNATDKLDALWKEKGRHNLEQQEYLDKIGQEISRMKNGSIALVNQITTVSKIRIYDPCDLKGVLSGVSLSEDSMEKINKKIKELYIF